MTLMITNEDTKKLPLSIKTAIPLIEDTFRQAGEGTAENPARYRMPFKNNGFVQFGPAALHAKGVAGFKMWANFGKETGVHKNSGHATNYLYDMATGELLALIHSSTIGWYRTSAATAVAVKYLSPENASTVGLFGAGHIAAGQLEAVCAVRPIRQARVYSRTPKDREAFCHRMSEQLGVNVIPATSPEEVPRNAEIVVTASTAETPVLFGDWLTGPGLVVAVGANHWYRRELDEKAVAWADLIIVDGKEQSKVESGNLLWAIAHGATTWERVKELGDVVTGHVPKPNFKNTSILFGGHGLAINDVAISAKAYELAQAAGIGSKISL